MTELTEASLYEAISQIREAAIQSAKKISNKPTKLVLKDFPLEKARRLICRTL